MVRPCSARMHAPLQTSWPGRRVHRQKPPPLRKSAAASRSGRSPISPERRGDGNRAYMNVRNWALALNPSGAALQAFPAAY
jgi:hypothetical protein